MAHIVSFTGAPGTGKTTLARLLIERVPHTSMVVSYTTRSARETDLPGEYQYVSKREFEQAQKRETFLWTAMFGGNDYGTLGMSILDVLKDEKKTGIMILTPDAIPKLQSYVRAAGAPEAHTAIFMLPPPYEVLFARLKKHGDPEAKILGKLEEAADWEARVRALPMSFHFLRNDEDKLEEAFEKVHSLIQ